MSKTRRSFVKRSAILSIGFPILNTINLKGFFEPGNIRQPVLNPFDQTGITGTDDPIIVQEYLLTSMSVNRNLTIICKDLTIDGQIEALGKEVNIYAKNIYCRNNSVIDASGKSYNMEPAVKALNGSGFKENKLDGQNGSDGADGQNGEHGGLIRIYANDVIGNLTLKVNGGNGGNGQDGGDGVNGNIGNEGASGEPGCDTGSIGLKPGGIGGKGGKGGDAGKGGNAGAGARFGFVEIRYINQPPNIHIIREAGADGIAGKRGIPGTGGTGGPGGENFIHWAHGGKEATDGCRDAHSRAAQGPVGDKGYANTDGSRAVHISQFGASSKPEEIQKKVSYDEYVKEIAKYPVYGKILLQDLEYSYINASYSLKGFDVVASNLSWILNLAQAVLNQQLPQQQKDEWTAVAVKSQAFHDRLKIGANYWGDGLNYITRLRTQYLQTNINALFVSAVKVENFYRDYKNQNTAEMQKVESFRELKNHLEQVIDTKKSEINTERDKTNSLNEDINQLNVQIQKKYEHLLQTEQAFRDAIAKKSDCSFDKTFACIELVVGVALAVYSGGTSLALAIDGIRRFGNEPGDTQEEYDKNVVKNNKEFEGNAEKVGTAIVKLKDLYDKIKVQLAEDNTLISIERGNFEKLLEAYKGEVESKQLKEEFDQYVKTIDVRNQKRLLYTEGWLKILTLTSEVEGIKKDISKVDWDRNAEQNLIDRNEIQQFIEATYFQTKVNLLYLLYLEKKAIDYWSLNNPSEGNHEIMSEKEISFLQAAHIQNVKNIIQKNEERGSGASNAENVTITFSRKDYPLIFASFIAEQNNQHNFLINIPPSQPPFSDHPWKEIFAHTLEIKIKGISTDSGDVVINCKHFGNSAFKNVKGQLVSYNHKPALYTMTYDIRHDSSKLDTIKNNLIGNATNEDVNFTGVSPFATWSVEIDSGKTSGVNKGLSFSDDLEIDFVFGFTYRLN